LIGRLWTWHVKCDCCYCLSVLCQEAATRKSAGAEPARRRQTCS
jgi:hypothetical protein